MTNRWKRLWDELGCFLIPLVLIAVIAFAVWAWFQPGGDSPSYWH
ncbi:hypothetical protein [Lentzea sp. NPDC051838]